MHRSLRVQSGFGLTELLVGGAAGLFVVAGTTAAVVAVIGSNADSISYMRLNQDLNALMSIMVSEIRRAGYNGDLATPYSGGLSFDATSSCVHYSYAAAYKNGLDDDGDGDKDEPDELEIVRHYGFKLNDDGDAVVAPQSEGTAFTCASQGSIVWEKLNDVSEVEVTGLTFADNSRCLDGDGAIVACGDASAVVKVGQLTISLSGALARDPQVTTTVQETVRIRNNEPI